MSSGLPTPPTEADSKHSLGSRRSTKSSKQQCTSSSRATKRTSSSLSHEHGGVIIDGRHKRVWKACERCRMKKTKCDGESPCKRCKDDGLVCTAGSRKKTEFKQLPRGYAEVLENTQYALIATVQKLYTMVRNGESWDLGDPEVNDRGMPVIHNIAEKLGCIRPSPDLPYAFPEDAEEFAELQAQMKMDSGDDEPKRKSSEETFSSRTDRASSSESDHSELSKDYNQMLWSRQQQQIMAQKQSSLSQSQVSESQFGDEPLYQTEFKQEPLSVDVSSTLKMRGLISPVYSEFQANSNTQSPVMRADSPFSPWSAGGDDFLGQSHMLDLTALYMRQQQGFVGMPRSTPYSPGLEACYAAAMNNGTINPANLPSNTYMAGSDGTIRPNMLDCNTGYDLADQMDSIMFGQNVDYEAHAMLTGMS